MVQVLVLADAPFGSGQASKETVDFSIAAIFAQSMKVVEQRSDLVLCLSEVRFILHNQFSSRRSVLSKRFFAEKLLLEHPANEFSDKKLLHRTLAGHYFQDAGIVFQHLRDRHFSPLPL